MEERTRARPDERMAMMMLASILESLEDAVIPLSRRLQGDKYAMSGLKAAITNIRKVYSAAAKTIDDDSLRYIVKNSDGYEIVIRQKRVLKDPCWMYVKTDDLQQIVERATQNECGFCLMDGGEVKQCKTRKALLNIVDEPNVKFG